MILTQNPAAESGSRVSLKNLSAIEIELHEAKRKLEETEAELEKQIQFRKLAEKRLQITHWKALRAQGGLTNENARQKAILDRATECEKALQKIFTPKQV